MKNESKYNYTPLPEPVLITEQKWPENVTPLLSISCITYNHEDFIRDAIEGFLMQKTSFPVEILIHDDASPDGTQTVIKEYEEKYPNLIWPIYQSENQYSKGIKISATFNWPRARGKYIALCEGDDYWIDPLKLQKQVMFLEANDDCSLCFHAAKHINTNNPKNFYICRPKKIPANNRFGMKHAIWGGGSFTTTNSMVYRMLDRFWPRDMPSWLYMNASGDFKLLLFLASKGEIGYLDDVMSVYRIQTENSWTKRILENKRIRSKHVSDTNKMLDSFNKWTNNEYYWFVLFKKAGNVSTLYLPACLSKKMKSVFRAIFKLQGRT